MSFAIYTFVNSSIIIQTLFFNVFFKTENIWMHFYVFCWYVNVLKIICFPPKIPFFNLKTHFFKFNTLPCVFESTHSHRWVNLWRSEKVVRKLSRKKLCFHWFKTNETLARLHKLTHRYKCVPSKTHCRTTFLISIFPYTLLCANESLLLQDRKAVC